MKTAKIASGLAVIALTAGLSACGSSSSKTTTTTAASGLSRAALATRADSICATANAQLAAIKAPSGTAIASDPVAAAGYFDKVFPIADAETKAIQALVPASNVAADWSAFVNAQVAADQLLQTVKQKADAKDPKGLKDLANVKPAGQKVTDAANKIGAKTCAGR
ncbi:MAG: hypothetical protein ACR2KV_15315 [Solirubrobacteraceae bacterium]